MHLLFIGIFLIQTVQCARILGVFSLPWYSHFVLGEAIFKELAERGHEVTVISSFPQQEEIKNYKDVTITELNGFMENMKEDGTFLKFPKQSIITSIIRVEEMFTMCTDISLRNKNVQNLLRSNETFDVIILQHFLNEAYFGFMHRFKAPVVLIANSNSFLSIGTLMGSPTPFSYIPNHFIGYPPNMNFWQRMHNTFIQIFQSLYWHFYSLPRQNAILQKHFPGAPHIENLIYNTSIFLINHHPALSAAVPLQPNIIGVGGFHVRKYRPLSVDLQKYLDDAKEGVVYFSIGSFQKSKYLPAEKVQAFLNAFAKLKIKVLWKWEDDELLGKPPNVRTEKWLSQAAVLAHENVKVFITHGGRLSVTESLYFGKPVLGIPLFADQGCNVKEAEYLGYGLYLSFLDLNEENLSQALREITENPKYAKTAQYRSQALHDLPITPMDNAVHWIEYVIKHKDLPHLKNASLNLSWYQLLLLDVILFCGIMLWILKKVFFLLLSRLYIINNKKIKTY